MNERNDKIVITGAGLASSLGLSREETWQGILAGRSGMGPLSAMETPLAPGKDGAQAMDLPADFAPALPREARYLKWTIAAALRDAGVSAASPYPAHRCACLLGTTLHGMRAAGRHFRSGDFGELRQFLAGNTLDLATGDFPFGGLNATTCSACSSSLGSIAMGVTLLQGGQADLVVAGGYDTISEYVYGGFNSLRLVADGPIRPFAKQRQGMKLAEGYGIVVLERAADAERRGARPLATILGWGESADAHHLTQPHPQGEGAAQAMREALARAGLTAADIDLIAAHATGTPDNDAGEYAAFSNIFGEGLGRVPVVAFKSHLGHTLGGAGAVELILSAMALRDQIVPTCANVKPDEVEFENLRLALGRPTPAKLRATLNTSLGFGGANTCVILGDGGPAISDSTSPGEAPLTLTLSPGVPGARGSEVYITGIGVIAPGMVGNDALLARLADGGVAWETLSGSVPDSALEGLLNARRVRRMSEYVKLTLATATLALRDAGIADTAAFARDCAAVLGSTHGSANYSVAYYGQIVKEGLIAANPMLFAEAVPNAGAAQLSLMLSLKGACQTVIGTRTAGLDALSLAASRIAQGDWDHAMVSAGEEFCPLVIDGYRHCGADFKTGAGAVTFILESRESMERRGGKARGRILASAAASAGRSEVVETIERVLEELNRPANVLSSACGTWIDRAEAVALRRGGAKQVSGIYGHVAETFSASPLIALAAVMLAGKMPRRRMEGMDEGERAVDSVAAICTGFTGVVSGVSIELNPLLAS